MTINTDLLLEIREQITTHPETHDQGEWGRRTTCGTTHCIAGWAAVLSGAKLDWRTVDGKRWYTDTVNGGDCEIDDFAARVMGLDDDQRGLFYTGNDGALELLDDLIEKGKNAA